MVFPPGKWRILVLGAEFDKTEVPIYRASRGCRLFKTLLSNACRNECKYCAFRAGRPHPRERWEKDKLVKAFLYLYEHGVVDGLFLTSSIYGDPDRVVEDELSVVEELRKRGYSGYIHLRLMPGVSRDLVREAARLADRIGVNVEAPKSSMFNEITSGKADYVNDVLKRLEWCVWEAKKHGCSVDSQVIVGASGEPDEDHLELAVRLFGMGVDRLYFSGFTPIPGTPMERVPAANPRRVRRLYQASMLLQRYGFSLGEIKEILVEGMLPDADPKVLLAEKLGPVDPNEASWKELVRVPGIGPRSASQIIAARRRGLRIRDVGDLARIIGWRRALKASRYLVFPGPKLS